MESLVEKPVLNFERSSLQSEDICGILAELYLLFAQILVQLFASHLQVVPSLHRLACKLIFFSSLLQFHLPFVFLLFLQEKTFNHSLLLSIAVVYKLIS